MGEDSRLGRAPGPGKQVILVSRFVHMPQIEELQLEYASEEGWTNSAAAAVQYRLAKKNKWRNVRDWFRVWLHLEAAWQCRSPVLVQRRHMRRSSEINSPELGAQVPAAGRGRITVPFLNAVNYRELSDRKRNESQRRCNVKWGGFQGMRGSSSSLDIGTGCIRYPLRLSIFQTRQPFIAALPAMPVSSRSSFRDRMHGYPQGRSTICDALLQSAASNYVHLRLLPNLGVLFLMQLLLQSASGCNLDQLNVENATQRPLNVDDATQRRQHFLPIARQLIIELRMAQFGRSQLAANENIMQIRPVEAGLNMVLFEFSFDSGR
ncbi:hypothetical protein C8R45DRAFT_1075963 [Mycena sanguinolenta]|nr:hypothetical protein C8R45DRAFT_1075963 [Mycena sanguinolenta]